VTKIHVVAAIARDVKTRVHAAITKLHHESQKDDLYAGLARTYRPKDAEGDQLPSESTLRQLDAEDVLAEARRLWTEAWDVEATLVRSSADARGTVVVDGETIVSDLPATYLLYLQKQLEDVYTFVSKLPVLNPAETWSWDGARGCWVTAPTETVRTKKTPKEHVLYHATKEHPAQVQPYNVDVVEGFWTLVKFSGALPIERKRELLLRVTRLRDAVKVARERANEGPVVDLKPADALLTYVLRRERDELD
jgi:hypothetical protein